MINLENLDDRSLEDILDEYKSKVTYLSTEWTNFQEPDPGITLIELFSWLKTVQHEYLNRKSEGVSRKFLDLLDVKIKKNRGSETFLEISNLKTDVNIPRYTRWKCGNLVFENPDPQIAIGSNILKVVFQNPEAASEQEYYKFDGSNVFYIFGKDVDHKKSKTFERSFTVSFDSPLPSNSLINLYFSIYNSKGLVRNPIKLGDNFESIADIKWEYYGTENGVTGWHGLKIFEDQTHNFLFSGVIRFQIGGICKSVNEEYKIRATLIRDEYDYPPRIDNIFTNTFLVRQTDTKCFNKVIKKEDILSDRTVEIKNHVAIYGRSEVYYKKYGGWVKTNAVTFSSKIKEGKLIVDLSEIWDKIKDHKHSDDVIMVVSYSQDIKNKMTIGSGEGISNQKIRFDIRGTLYDGVELLISENINGEEVFFKWNRVDDFYSSSKYDRHFVYLEDAGIIEFGDHEYGVSPRLGVNNIKLCKLVCTAGENSNIKENQINAVSTMNKNIKNARITQVTPAIGGEDVETIVHASARAADMFADPHRAVSVEDYEEIVKSTPGLMFSNVKILPNYMPGEDVSKQNCITVAVRWNRKVGLTIPKSFENNIMRHLDKYRLINTKIRVVGPDYIGITVNGDLVVNSFYREEDKIIEKEIKKFVKKLNLDFGKTLHFGDMFGMIDKLKYVSYINKLKIIPSGNYIQNNVSEDILVPPNGIYYIEKIEFNYVRNPEIYRD